MTSTEMKDILKLIIYYQKEVAYIIKERMKFRDAPLRFIFLTSVLFFGRNENVNWHLFIHFETVAMDKVKQISTKR